MPGISADAGTDFDKSAMALDTALWGSEPRGRAESANSNSYVASLTLLIAPAANPGSPVGGEAGPVDPWTGGDIEGGKGGTELLPTMLATAHVRISC